MRNILHILLVVLLAGLPLTLDAQPKLTLDTTEIDLGEIFSGETAKARITLKSTGTSPLKIVRINTSCGCTTVKQPSTDIAPGESGVLEVEFNSSGFRGKSVKYVYIESNDPVNQYTSVTLAATIREELEPAQGNTLVWFGDVPVGSKAEQSYALKNITTRPIGVKGITSTSKSVTVSPQKATVAPGESIRFTITVAPTQKGYLNESFSIETDSKRQKRVVVRVSLMGVPAP